jgi:epoxyqueuosine reductase
MKNKHFLTQYIKAEAKRLGFDVCGITHAEPVAGKICKGYRKWLADGNGADMDYLSKNIEKRLDPTLLVEDVKSIV